MLLTKKSVHRIHLNLIRLSHIVENIKYFKKFGSTIRVTRFKAKVAPNMADPISLDKNIPVALTYEVINFVYFAIYISNVIQAIYFDIAQNDNNQLRVRLLDDQLSQQKLTRLMWTVFVSFFFSISFSITIYWVIPVNRFLPSD